MIFEDVDQTIDSIEHVIVTREAVSYFDINFGTDHVLSVCPTSLVPPTQEPLVNSLDSRQYLK